MNMNLIRTILGVIAMLIVPAISFLGCTQLPGTTTVDCSASWLEPKWAAMLSFVLGAIVYGLKAFGGTGTVTENLASPQAPVVAAGNARAGTVTPAQVNSTK